MFETIRAFLPAEWQGTFTFFASGLSWIPEWQRFVLGEAWASGMGWQAAVSRIFLLIPAALLTLAMWCTMSSLYTLPFRSGRGPFLTAVVLSWWDAGRAVWFFWAGMIRVGVMVVGWVWGLLKTALRVFWDSLKGAAASPFALLDWTSRKYFTPGVPWVAFLLIVLWSAIEATIFTFTLRPTMSEVLADIVGFEPNALALSSILWLFLFFLIAGSFACLQVLTEAIRDRKVGQIVQMIVVEFFVAFFEVLFLYRELIDAVTPWLVQQTGEDFQLGLTGTLGLAFFGWVGVRGMTWFLFGRYGTPALLAVLSRQTITMDGAAVEERPGVAPVDAWRAPIVALKSEMAWFKAEAREMFELLSLPVLQLLAAMVNFIVVVLLGRPIFSLPFRSLDQVMASTPLVRETTVGAGGQQ